MIYLKKTKNNILTLIENIRVKGEEIYLEETPYKFYDKKTKRKYSDSKENLEPKETKEEDENIKKEDSNPEICS